MSLMRIRSLRHFSHQRLSLGGRSLHGGFERIVERGDVRQGSRRVEGEAHVAQVVDGHSGADNDDVLIAKRCDGLAQAVVLIYVWAVVLAHLHDGDVEGVFIRVEG